mmetsp:Transcript_35571/g.84917  ORF Transcript_35571/g.84917 Transcript_35571/m.84917 type:complete len:213 (-) Transcript_35571:712-1350(-)
MFLCIAVGQEQALGLVVLEPFLLVVPIPKSAADKVVAWRCGNCVRDKITPSNGCCITITDPPIVERNATVISAAYVCTLLDRPNVIVEHSWTSLAIRIRLSGIPRRDDVVVLEVPISCCICSISFTVVMTRGVQITGVSSREVKGVAVCISIAQISTFLGTRHRISIVVVVFFPASTTWIAGVSRGGIELCARREFSCPRFRKGIDAAAGGR